MGNSFVTEAAAVGASCKQRLNGPKVSAIPVPTSHSSIKVPVNWHQWSPIKWKATWEGLMILMLSCSKNCKHVTHLKPLTVNSVQTPEEAQLQIHLELRASSPDRPVPPVPLSLLPIPETTFLGSRLQRKLRKMRKHHGDVLQQWSSWKKRGIHLACPDRIH